MLAGGAIAALVVGGAVDVIRRTSARRRPMLAGLGLAGLGLAVVWGGQSTPSAPASVRLAPEVAHKVAAAEVKGDPAISQLSFGTFSALGRSLCEGLNTGGSAREDVIRFSQVPTGQGIPMRLDSAKAIAAASIRAYCPHQAPQLDDLDALE